MEPFGDGEVCGCGWDAWEGFAEQNRKALGNHAGDRGVLAEFNGLLREKLGHD